MRSLTILAWATSLFTAWAQNPPDSVRSFYIQEYPNHFFVWPVIKQRSLTFEVTDRDNRLRKIEFVPNNRFTMGLGMYVFDVLAELAFAVPLNEENTRLYGTTKARDWQVNILSRKWGGDAYYQKYEGFYRKDSRVAIPAGMPFPQRPDLHTRNFGISGFYVFNHRRFSLRSSFNFADRQLRRQGSWIIYGTINAFSASEDSVLIPPAARADIGEGSDFTRLQYTTFGLAPGYSYNLIWRKFFLNGTLTAGPAHHWVSWRDAGQTLRRDITINSTATLRLALGYANNRWFCGTSFSTQARIVKFEGVRVSNNTNLFRLQVGFRFAEKGVLKKRAWDLLPFRF
ncbi:MAG: hypothetical protein KatS3mg032_0494 [Cyclobacteriaceae bacterium]|nr:MAG: hypothetical protein KatS3mg032_0494 [Cyclobacteriaceae bacterium]